jgi:hypothetical protein
MRTIAILPPKLLRFVDLEVLAGELGANVVVQSVDEFDRAFLTILSANEADWIGTVLRAATVGAYTRHPIRPIRSEERLDIMVEREESQRVVLTIGIPPRLEMSLPRTSAESWIDCARQARASAQRMKDGAP